MTTGTVIKRLGYLAATLIILAALLVSVGRLLTPLLNEHLPDFEAWSSRVLQAPVKIGHVEISWNIYEPQLAFDDVTILDKKTKQPQFEIQNIVVNLKIFQSLILWEPLPESIKVSGVHVTVSQPSFTEFHIEELNALAVTDKSTHVPMNVSEIVGWILSQPKLRLDDIDITYLPPTGGEKSIILNRLTLKNTASEHEINGHIILDEDLGTRAHVNANWVGNPLDLQHVTAKLYLYLEGISLPEWLSDYSWHDFKIKQGFGSTKVWAEWDKNQWQEIQAQFQLYDLALNSLRTHKMANFPRLSAHLGWRREIDKQTLAGDDILIDFPDHLWPSSSFKVSFITDLKNTPSIQDFRIGYFDIADIKHFALDMDLLPKEFQNTVIALDPKGQIREGYAVFANSFNDFSKIKLTAQFSQLSFNSWKKFPSIQNASGVIDWNGAKGSLNLDSHNITILFPTLFANALSFDQLSGKVNWQKGQNDSLAIESRNIQVVDKNLKANVNMDLTIPENNSPLVDLVADFRVQNAAYISNYLPLQIFDPKLTSWLRNAFLSGQVEGGKAILKGKLADFPFDHGNGTFKISGKVKDVNFNFAPQWPLLSDVNGLLIFSGNSMTMAMDSGSILDIPLSSVTAAIPSLGNHPVLDVQGVINADAKQGFNFIQHSPLQDSIGKDLTGLNLTGPMQLKLSLNVPLNNPDKIKVQGDVALRHANLAMPVWNLMINNLSGSFRFTEDTIDSSNLQGKMFDEPIELSFATQRELNKPAYLKANFQGNIGISALQTWLKIPIEQYAQGKTDYQVELRMPSFDQPQPGQIFISTNLKGVDINLPAPYGKKSDEARDLHVNVEVSHDETIQSKIYYAQLLSAALEFEKTKEELKFLSGELRLGAGEINLPTQPGLLIVADMKQLDWDLLQPYYNWFTEQTKQSPTLTPAQNSFSSNIFHGIDLRSTTANLFGQKLNKFRIQATKNNNSWQLNVNSNEIVGQITVPDNFSYIQAKFQRFYVMSNTTNQKLINPTTIPALSISANDVRYNEKRLGDVVIETAPKKEIMEIKQLRISSALVNLEADGSWSLNGNNYSSHLQGDLTTYNVNDFLKQWGVSSGGLNSRWGYAQFDLTWPDAPYSPPFAALTGDLSIKLGQGRVTNLSQSTEAKIGLGRVLSIVSLQTIPRRLSLDFSDLFQNGYSFDWMTGTFKLKDGNVYTDDTRFNGPVARIDIAGRIGLKAKDYNLRLGVTTYVASSILPAAVPIAVGAVNPLVGVATWLVGAAVTQVASNATGSSYQYRISGPWDNPMWQQTR